MQSVRAITGATDEEFKRLEDSALELGKTTKFTSKEVAELQTEFGRLGFTTQEILDATEATINLSVATGSDLAKAADVAGSTLRAFGLNANQMDRVVDVMAESFNKSALGIENFSEAIKYVAPIAAQAGLSIEETTAMLGTLADSGIRGSQAGTSLRKIISDLGTESGDTAERIAKLAAKGLSGADAMDEVGRTAYASLLILAENASKTDLLTESLNKAAGAAKETARIMSDDLTGDVQEFDSAYEGLVLTMKGSTSVFREVVQAGTQLLQMLSDQDGVVGGLVQMWLYLVTTIPRTLGNLIGFVAKLSGTTEDAAKKAQDLADKNAAIAATVKAAFDSGDVEAYIKALDSNIYKEEIIAQIRAEQARLLGEQTKAATEKAAAEAFEAQKKLESMMIIKQLEKNISDFEKQKKEAFTVEAITNFNDKIKELREQLEYLNATTNKLSGFGKKVLNQEAGTTSVDTLAIDEVAGTGNSEFASTMPSPDMTRVREHFDEMKALYEQLGLWALMSAEQQKNALGLLGDEQDKIKAKQEAMRDMALQVGEAFGAAAIEAISGNKDVLQSIIQTVAKLISMFFKMAIAGTTAGAANTAAPPPVILALAAAGIAGITAIFSKIGGASGGVSGGSSGSYEPNVTRMPALSSCGSEPQQIEFYQYGDNLKAVLDRQDYVNGRLG